MRTDEGSQQLRAVKSAPGHGAGRPTVVVLSEAAGGVMRHVLDLYQGLRERGVAVKLVLSPRRIDERYKAELAAIPGGDLHYVTMQRLPHPSDWRARREIIAILRAIDGPVLLHAHSTKAGLLGATLQGAVQGSVLTPHAYRGTDPKLGGLSRRIVEGVEWVYSRSYDRVVAEVPKEYEYARGIGLPETKLRLIPNGISTKAIDFGAIRSRRSRRFEPPVLGFVGRLVYQKNPLLFLEVLRELTERGCAARAILLGEGPLREEMDAAAARYGLTDRLDWRGEVSANAVYPEMDVMVHTSLYEALPYSLIEACAALLPVVATSNPGSQAILGRSLAENLAPQQDAAALAEKTLGLLTDAGRYQEQTVALEAIARSYSTEAMIESYVALYGELSTTA